MRVYLDHQSATPVLPEIMEAMRPYFADQFGNASSLHSAGLAAREALKKAREQIAGFLNAAFPEEIIFISNGAEAVNLAIKGAAFANQKRGKHIVLSVMEHPAVDGSVSWLESLGFTSTRVSVHKLGRIDPGPVENALRPDTTLVCVHHANHDLGTLQPVEAIGSLCAARGIMLFVDAVASAGWSRIDVQSWNASLVAISPHRFYGPKGAAILYRNRRARLQSLIHGGMQEDGRRAGTENIPAIVGAGVAAEIASRKLEETQAHTSGLQRQLWAGFKTTIPDVRLNGPEPGADRLTTNLNLSFLRLEGEGLALALDMKEIAVAAGAACVTKEMRIPPALSAIGLDESSAKGTILMTLGRENTVAEIEYVLNTLPRVVAHLREMSPE
jgi:cysteine desulfurase